MRYALRLLWSFGKIRKFMRVLRLGEAEENFFLREPPRCNLFELRASE